MQLFAAGKDEVMGRNFKFTNKKHPRQAIISTILGVVSLLSMVAVIYLSFLDHGGTRAGYGLTGLLAVCFTLVGMVYGLLSLREKDSFHLFGWLGTILNLLVLVGTGYLFSLGAS